MLTQKERNTSLELLRIFCILAIIADHFTGQSGVIAGGELIAFRCIMTSLSRVACSIFIIISSWFLADMPFRFKRIVHTWMTVIMFTVPITLYCMHIGLATKTNLYTALLPIEGSPLWFAGYYMVLILLSPALNSIINVAGEKVHGWIVFVLFCLTVLYSTITADTNFLGTELWNLIFLYLATGYMKKYKDIPNSKKCFFAFGIVWCVLTYLRVYGEVNSSSNCYIVTLLRYYCDAYRARLQTLPNLILAYSAFFGFYGLKIKPSKFINVVASASLGVYCFHQVPTWYEYLWTDLFKSTVHAEMQQEYLKAFYIVGSILLVWIIGTILEIMRNKVSHILIEDRQYCAFLCSRIDNMANSVDEAEKIQDRKTDTFYQKVIILIAVYFIAVKFVSIEHYWYIPLNTNQSLVGDNLQLDISGDLKYQDGNISGIVAITNNGPSIENLSAGSYPVNLGVSIIDADGAIVEQDFLHKAIKSTGVLKKNQSVKVEIDLQNMSGYIDSGYGIRLEIVQESISWVDETAQYYWFGK